MRKKYATEAAAKAAKAEQQRQRMKTISAEERERRKATSQRHNQARRAANPTAENERIALVKRRQREAVGPQPPGYVYEPGRPGRKPKGGRTAPPKSLSHRPTSNPQRAVAETRYREARQDYDLAVANFRAAEASMPEARRRHLQAALLQRRAELVRMHAELTRGG